MLEFWAVVIVLTGAVLAQILPALTRPNAFVKSNANAEKRAIFRQQFDEIEQDKINGVLDATQYDIAKSELKRRMLDEVGLAEVEQATVTKNLPDRRLALILLVLLPVLAVFIYFKIGSPASIVGPTPNQLALERNAMAGDVEPLLETLKSKLEKDPGDGTGWALLARTYVELKRHADAVPFYEKAVKAIPNDPQLLADYADALAVVNGYNLAGKPEELANQALKLDPHHTKALLLAASAAFNRKDYKGAIVLWERLQQDLPADSDILPVVKASLSEAYALPGIKPPLPSANPVPSAQKEAPATGISGTVTIAPALFSKLDPAATVFVFARAAQGSPMPIAIIKTTAKDLPYSYQLDDSTALMPGNKLSQASEVVLVARISKSGDAKLQAGDLQGKSATVKPGDKVDIEINEVVQ
ncbi:c-type cytochrome biogenesis protein CcmI [Methylotenera sp.]|uniref:c-type cytochrome biogenesis protein CcmI n=1 Tax=Methylotenera sp. TaxID=2051956 RepID=UPI00272F14D4|nr:c-type cytochrome biogenesis protein CcmI [Methylotenera sp.]MDP2230002.1 c-type cytochrome biogenesis protein CcmI [Methylotenera sp.]MDP3140565.1 c-type cytochrome biogenesis protein CcmI [Methylotenera sp.]